MTNAKATAEMQTRMVRRMVQVSEEQQVVVLSLSQEEAESLVLVCNVIGGSPKKSRRAHIDAISEALQGAGVRNRISGLDYDQHRQSHPFFTNWNGVYFKDNA